MSIESRIPTEEINIKDLSLETPKRTGVKFHLDMAGAQGMIDFCNASKGDQLANIFKSEALELERLGLLDKITIPERFKEHHRSYLLGEGRNPQRFAAENHMWEHYIKLLAEYKRLFPGSVDPELDNFKWEEVREGIQKLTWAHREKLNLAAELKIVRPNEITSTIISPKAREKYFNDMRSAKQGKQWDTYLNPYANFRILNIPIPDDLIVNQETYDQISEELSKRAKPGFNNQAGTFGGLSADLRLTCADEVTVDDTGVRVFDTKLGSSAQNLPAVKKF